MSYIVHKAIEPSNMSAKALKAVAGADRILSPKYDGCHAVFLFNNGELSGVRSRDDKPVRSMQHVADALPNYYPWLNEGQHAVCGEAWVPGWDFEDISGAFRRHSNQAQLEFVPFDTVPWSIVNGKPSLNSNVPYDARLHRLGSVWGGWELAGPVRQPQWSYLAGTEAHLMACANSEARRLKSLGGYDGAVLALASGTYHSGSSGSSGEFMKIKPLMSETYTVIRTEPAIGDKTGKNTLALVVLHNGKEQKVSTGLLQAAIDDYVFNPSHIVGQRIEIEFMGITNGGMLREPRYKGIRTDA
jgi:ATP-dependent DNA ligase